jgi:hypothetical protein
MHGNISWWIGGGLQTFVNQVGDNDKDDFVSIVDTHFVAPIHGRPCAQLRICMPPTRTISRRSSPVFALGRENEFLRYFLFSDTAGHYKSSSITPLRNKSYQKTFSLIHPDNFLLYA